MPRKRWYSEQRGDWTLGRPAKKTVRKRDQLALQRHVRKGLQLLGTTQASLQRLQTAEAREQARRTRPNRAERAADYRWVRKHLSASDPHFTYAVARELFRMVTEHPSVAELSEELGAEWALWESEAVFLGAFDPDEEVNEGGLVAFLPPVQHRRLAEAIIDALEREAEEKGKRPFSMRRRSQMTKAIVSWFHRNARPMARRLSVVYPRRIEENYPKIEQVPSHGVFMALLDTAFFMELGLDPPS